MQVLLEYSDEVQVRHLAIVAVVGESQARERRAHFEVQGMSDDAVGLERVGDIDSAVEVLLQEGLDGLPVCPHSLVIEQYHDGPADEVLVYS